MEGQQDLFSVEPKPCFGCKYDISVTGVPLACLHPFEVQSDFYDAPLDANGYPLCYRTPDDSRENWIPVSIVNGSLARGSETEEAFDVLD